MTLRLQLLVLALLLTALPVSGWFTARRVEAALRAAEERALVASAEALARSLAPALAPLVPETRPIYVHRSAGPRTVDGFDDDWRPWLPFAQRAVARNGILSLELHLALFQRRLYGLLEVRDPTTGPAGSRPADQVLLGLGREFTARLTAEGEGGVRVEKLDQAPGDLPLRAAWRRNPGSGHRLEFSVPWSLARDGLELNVLDFGEGLAGSAPNAVGLRSGPDRPLRPVPDSALARRLAELAPPAARLWLLDRRRWVLAQAGDGRDRPPPRVGGWRRLVYDRLVGDALAAPVPRDPLMDLRLEGPEVDRALAGAAAVRLQGAGRASEGVEASVGVPVRLDGATIGALVLETPVDDLLLSTHRAFMGTVALSVLLTGLLALALLLYAARLSLRVRRLSASAELAAEGSGQPFAVDSGGDEIGDLSRSFSLLVSQLREYNRYLQELAARLAHELETPLTIVRSSLENLQAEDLAEPASTYLARAREGSDRLAAIFRGMREARRLEQSVARAEQERFDLAGLLRGCFESYREMDPGHRYRLRLERDPLMLLGSPDLIAQALDKLVDNARGFAPRDGEISLSLRLGRRGIGVLVGNDGPALPPDLGGRVFESMVSVRPAGEGFHLGLGLHMVRLIAEAHGGRGLARNKADASGVEIGFVLPPRLARAAGDGGGTKP